VCIVHHKAIKTAGFTVRAAAARAGGCPLRPSGQKGILLEDRRGWSGEVLTPNTVVVIPVAQGQDMALT